jgi:hypothetical protein
MGIFTLTEWACSGSSLLGVAASPFLACSPLCGSQKAFEFPFTRSQPIARGAIFGCRWRPKLKKIGDVFDRETAPLLGWEKK